MCALEQEGGCTHHAGRDEGGDRTGVFIGKGSGTQTSSRADGLRFLRGGFWCLGGRLTTATKRRALSFSNGAKRSSRQTGALRACHSFGALQDVLVIIVVGSIGNTLQFREEAADFFGAHDLGIGLEAVRAEAQCLATKES